jgi:hypothetical protein
LEFFTFAEFVQAVALGFSVEGVEEQGDSEDLDNG